MVKILYFLRGEGYQQRRAPREPGLPGGLRDGGTLYLGTIIPGSMYTYIITPVYLSPVPYTTQRNIPKYASRGAQLPLHQ